MTASRRKFLQGLLVTMGFAIAPLAAIAKAKPAPIEIAPNSLLFNEGMGEREVEEMVRRDTADALARDEARLFSDVFAEEDWHPDGIAKFLREKYAGRRVAPIAVPYLDLVTPAEIRAALTAVSPAKLGAEDISVRVYPEKGYITVGIDGPFLDVTILIDGIGPVYLD